MINLKKTALVLTLSLGSQAFANESAIPNEYNLCEKSNITFGFFNGVLTNESDALDTLLKLKSEYKTETSSGDKIVYKGFYNKTEGMKDFIETFDQRFSEETIGDRWELFRQVLKNDTSSTWGVITKAFQAVGKINQILFENILRFTVDFATNQIKSIDASKQETYAEHRAYLDSVAIQGNKLVIFAHSQGNLFANQAYNYISPKILKESVGVIHIAPASPITNGPHILAQEDLVINGLRLTGSVPSNTHTMGGFNRFLKRMGADIPAHGLNETYRNNNFVMKSAINNEVQNLFNTLKNPEKKAEQGFFNITLTWDGEGDVDLHVLEPNGTNVFFRNPQGRVGFLDYDNTFKRGPENYYASCDSRKVEEGIYRVRLANYARANGRLATVQLTTNLSGTIETMNGIQVGPDSGVSPNIPVFDFEVKKDQHSGNLVVNLIP